MENKWEGYGEKWERAELGTPPGSTATNSEVELVLRHGRPIYPTHVKSFMPPIQLYVHV